MKRDRKPGVSGIPLHPFLFAAYPVLALLAYNIDQVEPVVGLRPLLIALVAAGILLLLFRLIWKEWRRAALAVTLVLILFFSYGHVYALLKNIIVSGVYLFRHRVLAPLWLVLAGIGLWWLTRKSSVAHVLTGMLNAIGVVLLVFPIVSITTYEVRRSETRVALPGLSADLQSGQPLPNIYYIILDGYTGSDVLMQIVGYDNSAFLDELRRMGFYVAECSQSNYAQTQLSLGSSLNFDYIEALGDFPAGSTDRSAFWELLHHGSVRQYLESLGYNTVAFATGFDWTTLQDADVYLSPSPGRVEFSAMNEFEFMLAETTAIRVLQDYIVLGTHRSSAIHFRERTLFTLEKLPDVPFLRSPKFVFAHLVIPHPPYIFGPNGESVDASRAGTVTEGQNTEGYKNQVIFVNARIIPVLEQIINNSATPPVIILQGDHGPQFASPANRMSILNAYYLPGGETALYPSISPVNTFRIVFNTYFGQHLPLLDDISRFSTYNHPFEFELIQPRCEP